MKTEPSTVGWYVSKMAMMMSEGTDSRSNHLWGEFSESPAAVGLIGLTPAEKEQLTRLPRPLPLEGPRIHQPGTIRDRVDFQQPYGGH